MSSIPNKESNTNEVQNSNKNSSINMNIATNISSNDQNPQKKKEESDYFDNDEEEENELLFKEYAMMNDKKNRAIDDLSSLSERIQNNKIKIEEKKKQLNDLKEQKKKIQDEVINLLSNKESIEEIYKNQIYLISNKGSYSTSTINENSNNINSDINNLPSISIKTDNNEKSQINHNSNYNINTLESESINSDEERFKILFNEIKECDQKKYVEQVLTMFEDIYNKKDEKAMTSITNIIKNAFELYINNNSNENENDKMVNNFFSKLSLFISNYSLGRHSEGKIGLFLKYLMKINSINEKIAKYLKFLNKKYKDMKKELTEMINFLEKKNINLNEKRIRLENSMKDFETKIEFLEKNDVFDLDLNNNFGKKNKEKDSSILNDYESDRDLKEILQNNISDIKKDNQKNKSGLKLLDNQQKSKVMNRINFTPKIATYPKNQNKSTCSEKKITTIELAHKNRVKRILESGGNVSNVFGVNNYNPNNNSQSYKDYNILLSPKKRELSPPLSTNKIDKTIKIGSRINHNFISIINMTKTVPMKKKTEKIKTKQKKPKVNNDGGLKIINLEENFENEISQLDVNINSDRENNKTENKDGNTTSKNINKNEVQGYFLNIINSNKNEKNNNENIKVRETEFIRPNINKINEIKVAKLGVLKKMNVPRASFLNPNSKIEKSVKIINNYDNSKSNRTFALNVSESYDTYKGDESLSKRSHSLLGNIYEQQKPEVKKNIITPTVVQNPFKPKKIANIPISSNRYSK